MSDSIDPTAGGTAFSALTLSGSSIGSALMRMLLADDIVPGSAPSYQLCKDILLFHPLGHKMAEAPIKLAQSQMRKIEVPDAPDRVRTAFEREWKVVRCDGVIRNTMRTARAYGIGSCVLGVVDFPTDEPVPPDRLATEQLYFNVLDPLNTAGSLVLNQDPNAPDFQKTRQVTTNGESYHRSRVCVVMNEDPIYIAYTSSAFGFVGRSVYQRVLYPMKSFIQTMITDDMITRKAGVLVAKMESPSSIIDRMMTTIMGLKRALLQQAKTDNVLGIGVNEAIETLNMQNIDGAGTFARTNILKNIATGADMPAKLLENETLVQGFGEGTEDAKNIARYIDLVREEMSPIYEFFDGIVQLRAWNRSFYEDIQREFPERYGRMKYEVALSHWRNAFKATWPSLLKEPDSERVKVDDTKMRAAIAVVESLAAELDPANKSRLLEWAAANISDTEFLFSTPLVLDTDAIETWLTRPPPGETAEGGEEKEPGTGDLLPFRLGGASR